jgi:YD repeat-containing protein
MLFKKVAIIPLKVFYALALIGSSVCLADSVTQYKYDARGRLVKVSDDASKSMNYQYDEAGNRTQVGNSIVMLVPVITSFSAPNTVSSVGAFATISWASQDATYCALAIFGDSSDYPSLSTSGSQSVRMYENTGVAISCFNGSESDSEGKIIRVSSSGGFGNN